MMTRAGPSCQCECHEATNLKHRYSWNIGGRVGVLLSPRSMIYGLAAYTRGEFDLQYGYNGSLQASLQLRQCLQVMMGLEMKMYPEPRPLTGSHWGPALSITSPETCSFAANIAIRILAKRPYRPELTFSRDQMMSILLR